MIKRSLLALAQIHAIAICIELMLLSSHAAEKVAHTKLPAAAIMNTLAGRGDLLFVRLRSDDGSNLIFVVDTEMPQTVLDKSLESSLGKPVGTQRLYYGWFSDVTAHKYKSPKLYLGAVQLQLGDSVVTDNVREKSSGRAVDGILGLDCLRNYCVQLDFSAREIRFLEPDKIEGADLGKSFPLTFTWGGGLAFAAQMDYYGKMLWFGADTGDLNDGTLTASLPGRAAKTHKTSKVIEQKDGFYFPEFVLGGTTYTNLAFQRKEANILGLGFLARNLVTLNFPKQTMYLRPANVDPPLNVLASVKSPVNVAAKFIQELKKNGRLPGWQQNEKGEFTFAGTEQISFAPSLTDDAIYPFDVIFRSNKNSDSSVYYYKVVQEAKGAAWNLQKAWRTDQKGKLLEEFSVP